MSTPLLMTDWVVTPDKIEEAVRLIVAASDPLQIILFGSRARGDHSPESDVDLAVIFDLPEEEVDVHLPSLALRDFKMRVDAIAVSKIKYDLYRPWLNSVFHYIDQEGVVLYDRQHPTSGSEASVYAGPGRRVDANAAFA